MVALTINSKSKWYAPLPLWAKPSSIGLQKKPHKYLSLDSPAIFRFDNDDFMEEFTSVIAHDPQAIKDWVAQYETWRDPMPSPKPVAIKAGPGSVEYLYSRTRTKQLESKGGNRKSGNNEIPKKGLLRAFIEKDKALAGPKQPNTDPTLKLYQPAQQRYYMVGASLVCDISGFPDSSIDSIKGEKVSYVVRRLLPRDSKNNDPETWDEYAFVEGAEGKVWQQVARYNTSSARILMTGEEQYPLFPLIYHDECNKQRKILGGLIPVGKRETWLGARAKGTSQTALNSSMGESSPLERLFVNDVIAPWKNLIAHAQAMGKSRASGFKFDANNKIIPDFPDVTNEIEAEKIVEILARTAGSYLEPRDQIQASSWFILLDFAKFLDKYLPQLWLGVNTNDRSRVKKTEELDLYDMLNGTTLHQDVVGAISTENIGRSLSQTVNSTMSLRAALAIIRQEESELEAVDTAYDRKLPVDNRWPNFLFPLVDPEKYTLSFAPELALDVSGLNQIEAVRIWVDKLLATISPLLGTIEILTGVNDVIGTPPVVDKKEAYFVIRCVYEKPRCGPLFPPLLSEVSRKFHLASYFDPDAPARPIRIPMPPDISIAGLRKYKKNTGFIISDMLCGKIGQVRELTFADLVLSVLPWPFHKDLPQPTNTGPCQGDGNSMGMICSLSIPIVTLCALILLIIIVALFDIFFKWIPWLFSCFPIPGLSGKK